MNRPRPTPPMLNLKPEQEIKMNREQNAAARVFSCDECQSWTAEPVTEAALVDEWGWLITAGDEHEIPAVYCPECK